MLDHHIQRSIVYNLALADTLRFTELKPDYIENKLFTYHLKKVVSAGYAVKTEDGLYTLTAPGKRLGLRVVSNDYVDVDRPHSILFLVVRRKSDGAWLLYKRGAHPLKGKTGFMHAVPESTTTVARTAQRILKEKTGLSGEFKALGGGFFKIFKGEDLESFTHFTLLVCEDVTGELEQQHEHAEYNWHHLPDFTSTEMLPNMQTLVNKYQENKQFFIEERFELT